ncbi:hypothetical protein KCP71_24535 [Salmonella enterica subsp. enterica]|nr:hypothetical protein KCP71_24535 [Salmonella enterica subsp. enterica]
MGRPAPRPYLRQLFSFRPNSASSTSASKPSMGTASRPSRRRAQQKVADVQIGLVSPPLCHLRARRAVHNGEKAATLSFCRFSFRRSETAIGFFPIDDASAPRHPLRFLRRRPTTWECPQHFTFVKHNWRRRICYARFAFFPYWRQSASRLGNCAGGAKIVVVFYFIRFFGGRLLPIERLSGVARRKATETISINAPGWL